MWARTNLGEGGGNGATGDELKEDVEVLLVSAGALEQHMHAILGDSSSVGSL